MLRFSLKMASARFIWHFYQTIKSLIDLILQCCWNWGWYWATAFLYQDDLMILLIGWNFGRNNWWGISSGIFKVLSTFMQLIIIAILFQVGRTSFSSYTDNFERIQKLISNHFYNLYMRSVPILGTKKNNPCFFCIHEEIITLRIIIFPIYLSSPSDSNLYSIKL